MSQTSTPGPSAAAGGAETHRTNGVASKADPAEAAGPPNPDAEALAATHAEARAQAETGDLTGARTVLEEALAVGEVRLGHAHPRLAPLMVDLATIARNLGNLTEARTQLRRAYAIIVSASGPEHATALSVEGRLAAVTYRLGEPTEAYDWHLADVGARVLGAEHPAVRGAQERLATRTERAVPPGAHYVPSPESPGVYNRVANEPPLPGPPYVSTNGPTYVPTSGPPYVPANGPTYVPTSAPPYVPGADGPTNTDGMPEGDGSAEPVAGGRYGDWLQSGAAAYDRFGPLPGGASGNPAGLYEPSGIYAVEQEDEDAEVWQEPQVERTRRRHHGGGVAVVASLGAAILIAAGVMASQLFMPRQQNSPPLETAPSASAPVTAATTTTPAPVASPPPGNVTLKDNGGSVTLTWVDPSGGTVPFIVTGGRDGATSTPLETVPPGRTTSTIYGLNIRFNYCYTVTAVWSSSMIAPSIRTCTRRLSTSGAP